MRDADAMREAAIGQRKKEWGAEESIS